MLKKASSNDGLRIQYPCGKLPTVAPSRALFYDFLRLVSNALKRIEAAKNAILGSFQKLIKFLQDIQIYLSIRV
ncbi:hypothetical protein DWQ65_04975 [Treponema phagedenis]|nr:hypothetical protein HMPREF9554_00351 [Treponema phagedenis F0421]QSH93547.1 hypothetical protein C5O78_00465 [Treponema phagedenis]QSH99425.1 hypothetical protein DWQ65_04975 [Treponema phagedenis]